MPFLLGSESRVEITDVAGRAVKERPFRSRGPVHVAGDDALLIATRLTQRTASWQGHFYTPGLEEPAGRVADECRNTASMA